MTTRGDLLGDFANSVNLHKASLYILRQIHTMNHMIGPQPVLLYKAYVTLNLSVFEKKNNSEI